jgi:hypothetical protein
MADAFGKRAVPSAALDIEFGAGGDELLDHECVAVRRGQDERSEPAEKPRELSVDSAKPNFIRHKGHTRSCFGHRGRRRRR